MTYKGSNWTRGELGNVPDRNPTVHCAEETCDRSEQAKDLTDDWQLENDPEIPVLCPECKERASIESKTPTEAAKENNKSLQEFAQ
jgi:uncharacterized protein YlaI